MLDTVDHLQIADLQIGISPQKLIVIAGDIDDLGATFGCREKAAYDITVSLRSVEP